MNNEAEKMFESIRANELEEAQEYFDESLRRSLLEQDVDGLAEFAAALHQAGFLDEARDAYLLLKEMAPTFEEWDLLLAEIAIDQNRIEEGLDLLLQFDETSERYPHVLLMLADAYQLMGLYEVSEHKIKEAMKILPDEPLLQYALAKLYHSSGKYHEAIQLYEELLESELELIGLDNLEILLADCKNAVGEFEAAIHYLEQVPDEEHTADSLFQLGISYLQIREFSRSIQVLRDLLSRDPDYMSAYFHLSKALEEEHQLEDALVVIQDGISLNPFEAEFFLLAATLHLKLQQPQEAEAQVDQAIRLEPELMDALLLKADLLMQQERFDEVVDFLESSQKNVSSHPQFDWKLAQAYDSLEEYEESAKAYEKAFSQLNDDFAFLTDYAAFLVAEGNLSKLAEIVTAGLLIDPEDPYFNELKEDRLSEF